MSNEDPSLGAIDHLAARLNALGFLIEVHLANVFSGMPPDLAERARADFLSRARQMSCPADADASRVFAMQQGMIAELRDILDSAAKRETELRALARKWGVD